MKKCPEFIKKNFSPMIRNKLIKNEIFISTYNNIKNFERKSYSEKEEIQFNLLKNTLILVMKI